MAGFTIAGFLRFANGRRVVSVSAAEVWDILTNRHDILAWSESPEGRAKDRGGLVERRAESGTRRQWKCLAAHAIHEGPDEGSL